MTSCVDAKAFLEAMNKVSGVLRKEIVPLLGNIRVDFHNGICTVYATDLEVWMQAGILSEGDDFSFVFGNTRNVIKACRYYDGELRFTLIDTEERPKLEISCGAKAGEFPVIPATDYPLPPEAEEKRRYTVNAGELLKRIKRVKYATVMREDKPAARGVRFLDKRIWCIDGHRVAINEDASLCVKEPFIIPAAALVNLAAFGNTAISLTVGGKYARFSGSGVSLLTRLLLRSDEAHPDTIVPGEWRDTYTVDRMRYLDAINYLSEFADGKARLCADFCRGRLTLYAPPAKYTASVELQGDCGIDYGVDLKYMKEALLQFPGERYVTIRASSGMAPIQITAGGSDTALVAPARMNKESRRAA